MAVVTLRARGMLAASLVAISAGIAPGAPAHARNLALLIGVADYDNKTIRSLQGPRNDVVLMWRYLTAHGFAGEDIRVLAEGLPAHPQTPVPRGAATRAAIMEGFAHLAATSAPGDFVVIQYSGHGTTQPELDPDNNPEPEPGGRDQVLLAKDAGNYDAATRRITNGIIDDEIGAALDAIRAKGATVWAIIDACHAGTVTRSGGVVTRAVEPAQLGVPEAKPHPLPPAVPERAAIIKGVAQKGSLIGFFAVDAWSEAIERAFPDAGAGFVGAPGEQRFGLFTWHLVRALNGGRAQTYRDLARLVSLDMSIGNNLAMAPLPLFDGDLDRTLSGARMTGPRRFAVTREAETLTIHGGLLDGIDRGAEIGLFEAPLPDAKRLASATIVAAEANTAHAAPPPALATADGKAALWASVEGQAVSFRFRVTAGGASEKERQGAHALLARALAQKEQGEALAIDLVEGADRDLQAVASEGRIWLVPEGMILNKDPLALERSVAIVTDGRAGADVERDVRTAVWTFARAANLVRLAGVAEIGGAGANDVDVVLERVRETDPAQLAQPKRACAALSKPSPTVAVVSGAPAVVSQCDQVRLAITNRSERDFDVGIFYLDPFGEISVPVREWRQNGCVGFLPAKATKPLALRTTMRAWTDKGPSHAGLHRVLVFVLPRSDRLPPNLCHLLQPSLESARADVIATRSAGTSRGITALLARAALLDPALRSANPFDDDPSEKASAVVRQFTLDLRASP